MAPVTAFMVGRCRKSAGTLTCSGSVMVKREGDGQLSFSAHSVSPPRASDSSWEWKTGMMVSMPKTSWAVAASRAISSASRCASGNGALTRSIISTVTTELKVQAGTLSTWPR